MAELLSQKMVVGSWWFYDKSFNTVLIQTAWHATLVTTAYSASAEDKVTMGCFFEAQETTPIPKLNVYPDVLFLSSMLPPLSFSVYQMSLTFSEVEYIIPKSFVPLTYFVIHLHALQLDILNIFKIALAYFDYDM